MQLEDFDSSAPKVTARWADTALVGILLLVTLLCYANILGNGFVYDDDHQILENPYVKSWHFLPNIFGTTVWSFVGQAGASNYYRPLMTLSFLVLWQLFGPIPFGFHLFSIVMHAAVVVLAFFVGRRLFLDWRIGWISALLFALHPIHTEAVDWIAALPDLEVTFFILLALYPLTDPIHLTWKRLALTTLCFCFALFCKEPAFMFAPLTIVFVYFAAGDRNSTSFASKFYRYFPLCALGFGYMGLRIFLFGRLAPVLQRPKLTWPEAIYSAFALIVDYAKMLFWPSPLSAFHVFQASTSSLQPRVLGGIFIVILCAFIFWKLWEKHPAAAFSVAFTCFTLAPVLNARWMAGSAFSERYLYLPSLGFCWFISWCGIQFWDGRYASQVTRRGLRAVLPTTLGLACISGITATILRNSDWRSDLSLYTQTLRTDPDAHNIRGNLASTYFNSGDSRQAERQWQIVLARKPESVETMVNLGMLYTRESRYSDANAMLEKAIAANPLHAGAHYNLANLLHKLGHDENALFEFRRAVDLSPLNPLTHELYARQLLFMGNYPEAETQFQKSVELSSSLSALQGLARLYLKTGQTEKIEPLLRRILAEAPYDGNSHLALAKIFEAEGRKDEAKKEFQAVFETDSANPEAAAGLSRLQ